MQAKIINFYDHVKLSMVYVMLDGLKKNKEKKQRRKKVKA